MTTADDDLGPDERSLATQLEHERPVPSQGLRRRVQQGIRLALSRRVLRRRSIVLLTSGWLLLAFTVVLALSAPR